MHFSKTKHAFKWKHSQTRIKRDSRNFKLSR